MSSGWRASSRGSVRPARYGVCDDRAALDAAIARALARALVAELRAEGAGEPDSTGRERPGTVPLDAREIGSTGPQPSVERPLRVR
jgi:hypothetical protein